MTKRIHAALAAAAWLCALTPALAQSPAGIPGVVAPGIEPQLLQEAFKFTEGLFLKDRSYLLLFSRRTLAEHQLSNLMKQRRWRVLEISLQSFPSL